MRPLSWYAHRLRAMSMQEACHRLRLSLRKRRWRRFARGKQPPQPNVIAAATDAATLAITVNAEERRQILAEADRALAHRWNFFDADGTVEPTIDWQADPTSGVAAPKDFSFDIDYRDERLVGNIKNTWEKNRHHHLTVLALAEAISGDRRYGDEVRAQVLSWIDQNPYLVGVNWNQGLEAGIRLIAWLWCERLLSERAQWFRSDQVRNALYLQQLFIAQTQSQGSSANNHLIGEMAGLFVATVAWPYFAESAAWEGQAREVLEREIIAQSFACGIHREQGFSYQIFCIEFFLLALIEARRVGRPFSKAFDDRLRAMIEVVTHLTDVGGNLPRYGDGDEGMAVQLQSVDGSRVDWIYEVGRATLGANVPAPKQATVPAKILGCTSPANAWKPPAQSIGFPDAGLFALSHAPGTRDEIFVLADAGPLGFLSIAAHGHADALAITLSVAGLPILVDPGTYCYHTDLEQRRYFRGTSAHNTVAVDGLDQSTQAGPFLWTRKACCTVEQWEARADGGILAASHDGYKAAGVRHFRRVQLMGTRLMLHDRLTGAGRHRLEAAFHLAPECDCVIDAHGKVAIRRDDVVVTLTPWTGATTSLQRETATHGWYSPRFGHKVPATTILMSLESALPVERDTILEIRHER